MKTAIRSTILTLAFLDSTPLSAAPQTKPDEEAVRRLPQAFSNATNKHDGHELAKIMAADVDFVTVGAMWLHGRPDFEKYHTRLLSGLSGNNHETSPDFPSASYMRTWQLFTGVGAWPAIET